MRDFKSIIYIIFTQFISLKYLSITYISMPPLLQISPYIAWKGLATNSAVPSFSRPDLNVSGANFKPNPIKHWRKQLIPTTNSGVANRRAGVGMPMDLPGGSVYLGDDTRNTNCLENVTPDVVGLKENIMKFNNTNFQFNDISGCLSGPCNPEINNKIKKATTILSKTYYGDTKAYMRSRCNLYDQNLTALPIAGITYLNEAGELLYPNATNTARQTQDCVGALCKPSKACQTIYKHNNLQYAKQGAVDSSDRLTRLKLNTINTNASSFKTQFNTTAPRYLGASSTPYFLKSKYQVCVPLRNSGDKLLCPVL